MQLVFDKTISVARSTLSINSQTFLTRLGGSVSTGRTLLWILLTGLEVGYYSWGKINLLMLFQVMNMMKGCNLLGRNIMFKIFCFKSQTDIKK